MKLNANCEKCNDITLTTDDMYEYNTFYVGICYKCTDDIKILNLVIDDIKLIKMYENEMSKQVV